MNLDEIKLRLQEIGKQITALEDERKLLWKAQSDQQSELCERQSKYKRGDVVRCVPTSFGTRAQSMRITAVTLWCGSYAYHGVVLRKNGTALKRASYVNQDRIECKLEGVP